MTTAAAILSPVFSACFGSVHAPDVHAQLATLERQYTRGNTPVSEVPVAGIRELVRSLRHRERIQVLHREPAFTENNDSVMGLSDFAPLQRRADSINTIMKVYFEEAVLSMDALNLPDATRAHHRELITAHWHQASFLDSAAEHIRMAFEPQPALA